MSSSTTPTATLDEFKVTSIWLTSISAAADLPNDTKLELYGLFKFINTSSGPSDSRPSIFSPTARAKNDAWTACFARYGSLSNGHERAQGRYVEIAKGIGWSDEGVDEEDEDVDWDDLDGEPSVRKEQGKGKLKGGMAASVSVMADEEGEQGDLSSPIHEAVVEANVEEVRALLSKHPDLVNAKDEYGYTPLHLAADRGYPSLVNVLLEAGADRDAKDEDEQTPCMLAEITGRGDITALLRRS